MDRTQSQASTQFEVHDSAILANARAIVDAAGSGQDMANAVLASVHRN